MNAGVLSFAANGSIRNSNAAPVAFSGGAPTDAGGLLSWVSTVPAAFVNGLGYVANGSLSVSVGGVIAAYSGGIPLAADGRVCAEVGAPVSYHAGLPFTATGRLAFGVLNATAFSDGFSGGFA